MVERRALERLEPEPVVMLTAPPGMAPEAPQAPPPVIKFDPWGHVLGRNRGHTFGGQLEARYGPAPPPVAQPAAPGRDARRKKRAVRSRPAG